MFFSTRIALAWAQLAALCSASPLLISRSSGPACTFIDNVGAISCNGGCCGWALSGASSPFCDASTASTLTLSSKPDGWLSSCSTLKSDLTANNKDYVLTTYQQNTWHAVVSNTGCRFEVNISDPQDSNDPIRLTGGDIATFLTSGIPVSQSGGLGATGSTSCYSFHLQWRMVPPGN
ncbi:hypothetical protein E8E14_014469 [Neopestalotiopsis sp. 37M]|nr:hypothetical protein E8E14_014469 [Neopestalotiopsis sp. 37M]